MSAHEALARVLLDYRRTITDTDQVKAIDLHQAQQMLRDPAPLLDALPDDALIEALVRRGALTEEDAIQQARGDGKPGYVFERIDGRRTTHDDAYRPFTVPVSRYVTEWQEDDR